MSSGCAKSDEKLAAEAVTTRSNGFASKLSCRIPDWQANDYDCDSVCSISVGHGDESGSECSHTIPKEKRHSFWYPYQAAPEAVKETRREATKFNASSVSSSTELGEIQQSVHRLRAQRTHVERLSQRNEELERQLAYQRAENETLQRVAFTLRGAEQENVAYLQRVKVLEQRARSLEEMCNAKRLEIKVAAETSSRVEQERDQLRQAVQDAQHHHEEDVKVLEDLRKKMQQRIDQLELSCRTQNDDHKRQIRHWKQKLKTEAHASTQTIDDLQQLLEQSCKETKKLEGEMREAEEQIRNLLATTVRQTAVIEECYRAVSEAQAQQQVAQHSYEEQLQVTGDMSSKIQRLEAKVASLKLSSESGEAELEKVTLLESKVGRQNIQLQDAQAALQEKQKEIESMQLELLDQRRSRLQSDERINKGFQHKERKLKSEISELQIALRDAIDEKSLLSEQIIELQGRLEKERKDRSRWATARLKLLAEFCDEESKLSLALSQTGSLKGKRNSVQVERTTSSRKSRHLRSGRVKQALDDKSYDGDSDGDSDKKDEQRRTSIVFG